MTQQPNRRKPSWIEWPVTSVLLVQFITYLFSIFGNPIQAGIEMNQRVSVMQAQFTAHAQADTLFKQLIVTKFMENAADHALLKNDIQEIKQAVIRPGYTGFKTIRAS
jgi:hypothetical protein